MLTVKDSGLDFKSLTRHDIYYIPTADLCLLVEHIQFRVHRYFFERESKWFSGKLTIPASPGTQPQGSSDSNAIILENLTPDQFARFLWVFYNPRYSIYEAAVEDWAVILSLAERWAFPEVKSLAIRELEQKVMLDVKRIKLYHENNVDRDFLVPRYAALCEREEPLSLAEGMDLGMETTLQIAAGREEARRRLPGGARSPLSPTVHGADLHAVVRELFKIAPASAQEIAHNSGALKPQVQPQVQPQPQPTQQPTPQPSPPPPTSSPKAKPQPKKTTPKIQTTKKGAKGPLTGQPTGQPTEPLTAQPTTTETPTKAPTPPSATASAPPPPPPKDQAGAEGEEEAKATKKATVESGTAGQEKVEDAVVAPTSATLAAGADSSSVNPASAQDVTDPKPPSATPGGESVTNPQPDLLSIFNQSPSSSSVVQPTSLLDLESWNYD